MDFYGRKKFEFLNFIFKLPFDPLRPGTPGIPFGAFRLKKCKKLTK